MPWEPWQQTEQRTLARYANPEAVKLLPKLSTNPSDLRADADGKLKTLKLIYDTLSMCAINYDVEPTNPLDSRQVIRQPATILGPPHQATCLDLALLFSGLYLHFDLIPLLILLKQHALIAVSTTNYRRDLKDQDRDELMFFDQGLLPHAKAAALQDLIERKRFVAMECTGVAFAEALSDTQTEGRGRVSGRMPFERAVIAGREQLLRDERPLQYALDVVEVHRILVPYPIDLPQPGETFRPGLGLAQTSSAAPSTFNSSVKALKQKTLIRRITSLIEEYEAINRQAESTIDEGIRLRLIRQSNYKIAEIESAESELQALG